MAYPALYPEFYFGIDGEKLPEFELNVTKETFLKLSNYFDYITYDVPCDFYFLRNETFAKIPLLSDFHDSFEFNFIIINDDAAMASIVDGEAFTLCTPKTLSEYLKCYGLMHGTGTWTDNAKNLLTENTATLDEVIGHREDIFEFLLNYGVDKSDAFLIAEQVRFGKFKRQGWYTGTLKILRDSNVPNWFIDSCQKIDCLLPRSHAMSYFKRYYSNLF